VKEPVWAPLDYFDSDKGPGVVFNVDMRAEFKPTACVSFVSQPSKMTTVGLWMLRPLVVPKMVNQTARNLMALKQLKHNIRELIEQINDD